MEKTLYKLFYQKVKKPGIGIFSLFMLLNLYFVHDADAHMKKDIHEIDIEAAYEDVSLADVFADIESKAGFIFTFDNKGAFLNDRYSKPLGKATVADVLEDISRTSNLVFQQINNNIRVREQASVNEKTPTIIADAAINVSGTVVSSSDGKGFPGVTVLVKGTRTGTVTNIDGKYSINVPNEGDTLEFSSVGFIAQEVAVNGRTTINITLEEDVRKLKEVVVIGYGTIEKKDLTGAVGIISGEETENQAVSSVAQALQGRVAGLNIRQTNGGPGSGAEISIRGRGTFGANSSPLVVIDGIITNGGLADVDPNSIEDVTVLKDATSAAIYGSRGANGVVLITTKRGKSGKEVISFQTYYSMDNVINEIGTVDAAIYGSMVNDFYVNQGKEAPYADPASLGEGTNWQDEIFRTGNKQSYSLTMSGGTEKNSHAITTSYYKGEGVVVNSKYSRFNFRVNNDIKPLKGLKIGSGIGVSYGASKQGNPQEAINRALIYAPNVKPYKEDGSYGIADMAGQPTTMSQPLVAAYERRNDVNRLGLLGNLYAEYEIITGLKFRTSFGLEYIHNDGTHFIPSYNYGLGNSNGIATLRRNLNSTRNYILDNILTYNKRINEVHNFNIMAGYTFQSEKFEYVNTYRDSYSRNDDYLQVLDAGTANDQARGSYTEWALQSYLGRLSYSYMDKYLFSSSIRVDESSRFAKNNRTGIFPAFSAGWVLSNEDFLQDHLGAVSYLKLRAGYGVLGNQDIGIYPYQALINSNLGYTFGESQNVVPGAAPTGLANQNISWEKTKTTGIGLEANFFHDKLRFIVDYYDRRTSDVLVRVPLPNISGLASSPYQNVGSVRNNGVEFTVDYRNMINEDFSYNAGFNLTINNNEVTKLDKGLDIILAGGGQGGVETRTSQGHGINSFYGYVHDGIFQTIEELENSPLQPNAEPGDIKFKDLNDDGVIDANDRTYIGDFMAKQIIGFNAGIKYKGFDLSIVVTGDFGRYQNIFVPGFAAARAAESTNEMWANRWTGPGTSNYVPRIIGGDPNNNSRSSDFWVRNQDYIRIQNLQLGYDFSNKIAEMANLSKLRIYVAAQNLATFTNYPGFDPETTANSYPLSRSVFLGVNLGL